MSRVYYKEEKIYGKPVKTDVINLENFNFLMSCPKPQQTLELATDENGNYIDWFRYIQFSNDGITYNDSEYGSMYLPKAIIFYDEKDYIFPTLFYFISLINDELEIREVQAGEDVKYFQIPELHKEVTDKNIIERIETSLLAVIGFLKDYKEPEKQERPKETKIVGVTLKESDILQLINLLTNENIEQQSFFSKIKSSFFNEPKAKNTVLAESIVKMAENPYDYFEKNIENLEKYQIYDASKNMYLLCLTATLEEWKLIKTVDWKDGLDDILFALKSISEIDFKDIDRRKFAKKGAEKIFALLNSEIENKTDKTLFCIDTDSDSYSFGLIEKSKIERLIKLGKDSKIEIYQFI